MDLGQQAMEQRQRILARSRRRAAPRAWRLRAAAVAVILEELPSGAARDRIVARLRTLGL